MKPSSSFLKDAVMNELKEEVNEAENATLRGTVALRIVRRVADFLAVPWSMIQDSKNAIHVHGDVSSMLGSFLRLLTSLKSNGVGTFSDEISVTEKLLTRDYFRLSELTKMIAVLSKQLANEHVNEDVRRALFVIFAVDGVRGTHDLKHYLENLQYPDDVLDFVNDSANTDIGGFVYEHFKRAHVAAFRKCVREFGWFRALDVVKYLLEEIDELDANVLDVYRKTLFGGLDEGMKEKIWEAVKAWKKECRRSHVGDETDSSDSNRRKRRASEDEAANEKCQKRKKTDGDAKNRKRDKQPTKTDEEGTKGDSDAIEEGTKSSKKPKKGKVPSNENTENVILLVPEAPKLSVTKPSVNEYDDSEDSE